MVQLFVCIEDNKDLVAHFLVEEMKVTLCEMHPNKAPGPDGYNVRFSLMWALLIKI